VNPYTEKSKNIRKTWILFSGFFIFVIGVGWVFSQVYGDSTILYMAVFFSVTMSVISYWQSDKIVLKMHTKVHKIPTFKERKST